VIAWILMIVASSGAGTSAPKVHYYTVPTTAMEPTIARGAIVAMEAFDATSPITRGMVVLFEMPETDGTLSVKRVVGLPGETIEIRSRHVFINGKPLAEPYAYIAWEPLNPYVGSAVPGSTLRRRDDLPPLVIPDYSYFLIGDNRDSSWDSRMYGAVPRKGMRGRVVDWQLKPAT
jgi:signal peptidase I